MGRKICRASIDIKVKDINPVIKEIFSVKLNFPDFWARFIYVDI